MRALAILLLLPCLALAEDKQCVHGLYDQEPYDTLESAAVVALGRLWHAAHDVEYSGYILELDGRYIYSEPVTLNDPNQTSLGCILFLPGSKLAAVFHTHMADQVFSKADKRHAAGLGVPSYIVTMRDGWILRYDPETRETAEVGTLAREGESVRFVSSE